MEALLAAVPMSAAELGAAVGRFESDMAGLLLASVRTAERAFAELDTCEAMINTAAARGQTAAVRLRELLAVEDAERVNAELGALEEAAGDVRRAMADFRLLSHVLGRDMNVEAGRRRVVHLTESGLPPLPSAYREGDFEDLIAIADRGAQLAPELERAHRERIRTASDHVVEVVRSAAATGFADERFAEDAMDEARRAVRLWKQCLEERRRDVG
ncbi:hypothetical protein ABZ464_04410 [Streptomyces sp. NPDC005820]|uniref:hypothetical protein n=1 Tax=Streptomyces sp. NPDC005820 TaxID=3157069 RepID=UPI0033F6E5F1